MKHINWSGLISAQAAIAACVWVRAPAAIPLTAILIGGSLGVIGLALLGCRIEPALARFSASLGRAYDAQVKRAADFDAKGHARWVR